jgi:molecular chaperone DnaK (HSP70)
LAEPQYIIGIDLGTTNTVVAYTTADIAPNEAPDIRVFEIPQLSDSGVVEPRAMLPSFILVPGKHEVPPESMRMPWNDSPTETVGEFARKRGGELPQRLISSSKSWLCNTMVDRNHPILPWECPDKSLKKSPIEASAAILKHVKDAWNHVMAFDGRQRDPSSVMENQDIYLTVPASFDAVARELTVRAAEIAGLSKITLLEEPQAAFYSWIETSGENWRNRVKKGDLVLVCDIGGGTSDFSLIQVEEIDGEMVLERIAVGNHLLVGGDNMDLALAYAVASELAQKGARLDSWQMRGLWHSCRSAKEKLLGDEHVASWPVSVLGRGSGIIGGTVKTELTVNILSKVLLEGFFPFCEQTAEPKRSVKTGIREMGLVYESDPAVTHHMAAFLRGMEQSQQGFRVPNKVLFNGGVTKPPAIRNRIMEVLTSWCAPDPVNLPVELATASFDLAVARGAAYFGMAKRGRGIRIRGGLGKSYYIGIAAAMPAVPGMPAPLKAVCVGPFGMEEGTRQTVPDQEFALIVGEPVAFDFLGSSRRFQDSVGTIVEDWEADIEPITTIETILDGDLGAVIPVTVEVQVTEIGTLELWCVSRQDGRRWKLEFNVREQESIGSR